MTTPPDLLTPAEVAAMFRLHPKTVSRWAKDGLIASIRTPGGKYRIRREDVGGLFVDEVVAPVEVHTPPEPGPPVKRPPSWTPGTTWRGNGDDDL